MPCTGRENCANTDKEVNHKGYLVGAGLLQSVHHGLKLQWLDLHLAVEPVEEGLVLRVHIVVGLLIVKAKGCTAEGQTMSCYETNGFPFTIL